MSSDDTQDAPKTVMCSKYEEELPAITSRLTFIGPFADQIRARVSQRAWTDWLDMQIKVINEYRLHLGEAAHREFLQECAERFFRFDGGDGSMAAAGPEGGLA